MLWSLVHIWILARFSPVVRCRLLLAVASVVEQGCV
jgi:hypothetical protein